MDVNLNDGAFADSSVAAFTRSRAAFDVKGVMSSLTVLRLRSRDLNLIERQLRAKVMQFPQFFSNAPIVLDVSELEGGVTGFPLAALVRALHVCRVVPVAITNIDEKDRPVATAAGLGVVSLSSARPTGDPDAPGPTPVPIGTVGPGPNAPAGPAAAAALSAAAALAGKGAPAGNGNAATTPAPALAGPQAPPPAPPPPARAALSAHRIPMVIRQPVRSGQLIYAEKNDLIVLAPVNPGAQIIADGNIHIYSTLRGRAVAGAQGYTDARIFCQKFEAELVAIAGTHLTFDDIPRDRRGRPSQVHLQDGACVIAAL